MEVLPFPFKIIRNKKEFIRRYEPWTIEVEATINPDYLVAARAFLTEHAECNAFFVRITSARMRRGFFPYAGKRALRR